MTEKKQTDVQTHASAEARALQTLVPAADIHESAEAYHLVVDMPGVDEKAVDVTLEKDVLAIEGQWAVEAPKGHNLVQGLTPARRYRRTFAVSDRIDAEHIEARFEQGVLYLTLPKQEQVKRRKIEIAA